MAEEILNLGGNIELTGFNIIDGGSMIIVKKIVGSYAKRFLDSYPGFQKLHLTIKEIHHTEGQHKNPKYELKGKILLGGKPHNAEITDYNLFFVLDKVLKKMESSVEHDENKR